MADTDIKQCPRCGSPLIIDEWDGWHWVCWHCEYDGGPATNKEIDTELQWYANQCREKGKNEKAD